MQGSCLVATQVHGMHPFLSLCKDMSFSPGECYVGRIRAQSDSRNVKILSDIQNADPHEFPRKGAALVNGIMSIVFLLQQDGSIIETGFENHCHVEASLPLIERLGLALCPFVPSLAPMSPRRSESFGCLHATRRVAQLKSVGDDDVCYSNIDNTMCVECDDTSSTVTPSSKSTTSTRSASPVSSIHSSSFEDARDDDILIPVPLPSSDIILGAKTAYPPTSEGSRGHPFSCGQSCKFAYKVGGCKDGLACVRCHQCFFRRSGKKGSYERGSD